MPSHETELARALRGSFGPGRLLAVGFDGSVPDATEFQQDLRAHRATPGSLFGAFVPPSEPFDAAVVRMSKTRERFDMDLAMTAGAVGAGGRLFVIGHNDAGARSAGRHLARVASDVEVVDYRLHCRAFVGTVVEPAPFDPAAWRTSWTEQVAGRALVLHSYPGVFAHGRADAATLMLLGALAGAEVGRALDVGCGNGLIGAWLAAGGASVECVDVDAVALDAARLSLEPYAGARAYASDVFSDVEGTFDRIVSNPPFHAGVRTTSEVTQRLIRRSPDHLERGGELWVVANKFLPYGPVIEEAFGSFTVPAEDARYRVYRARR